MYKKAAVFVLRKERRLMTTGQITRSVLFLFSFFVRARVRIMFIYRARAIDSM